MRSVLRVFALALLVSCALSQVCHEPAGLPDIFQTGMCNCYSGFAPTTADAVDCGAHPKCAGLITDAGSVVSNTPQRPVATFSNDHLNIVQRSPIVSNRKGSNITFISFMAGSATAGAATCSYPGPLWTKTVDSLDCVDVFTAAIPWSQSSFCGFAKDTAAPNTQTVVLKSTLVHTYTEMHKLNTKTYLRQLTSSFVISVSFLAQKALSSDKFAVTIPDATAANLAQATAVSNAVFNVLTGKTEMVFLTTTQWPFKLNPNSATYGSVTPVIAGITGVTIVPTNGFIPECDSTQSSVCTQSWTVAISANAATCDLYGVYTFTDTLQCRDDASLNCPGAAAPSINFGLTVAHTDLCSPDVLDTSAQNTYTLQPFSSLQDTAPTFSYATGNNIFWALQITDPVSSIDNIQFSDVSIAISAAGGAATTSDTLYTAGTTTAVGTSAGFKILSQVGQTVSAGTPAVLTFQYALLRSALAQTIAQLGTTNVAGVTTMSVNIVTSVTVNIKYHGNSKREVQEVESVEEAEAIEEAMSRSVVQQTQTVQLVLTPEDFEVAESVAAASVNEEAASPAFEGNSASAISPIFGLFVAFFVAFALKF